MPSISVTSRVPNPVPVLSQDRVMSALWAIEGIRSARHAADCLDRLFQATQAIGATASLYSVLIPEQGPELSSITLFACDPAFAQQHFDNGPVTGHPWVRFARTHTAPGTSRQVPIGTDADAAAIDRARAFGFSSCLIVPTMAGADLERVELLCLGKAVEDAFEGDDQHLVRMLARSLAAELHDWFSIHLGAGLRRAARLQPLDVQLLSFEREGLSTKQISQRTGMTMAAIDSRFQRINQRLNCPSRKASARRAAEHSVLEAALHRADLPSTESVAAIAVKAEAASLDVRTTGLKPTRKLRQRSVVPASPRSGDQHPALCTPSSARSAWPSPDRSSGPPTPQNTGGA